MTPITLIARALKRERTKAGLSLSALAERAGLAKSTLSQLEAAQGNPSIETLWAIANALDVPFGFLFDTARPEMTLVRAGEGTQINAEGTNLSAVLLSNGPPGSRRDLYRFDLVAGAARHAAAHPQGTIERALISSGRARIGPADALQDLGPGDYFRFPGDIAHSYEAISDEATVFLAMEFPR